MRKTLICMLAFLMLLSSVLVACGGGDSDTENKPGEKPGESTSQPESGKKPGGETSKTSQGLEYALNEDGKSYSVTGIGSCKDSAVIIPSTHSDDGKPVTSIGNNAFSDCSGLTSVTIPDSVIDIGWYAFSKCLGLTSVTIGNGVTSIGSYAFSGCEGLTSITIPDSVTRIANDAFEGCTRLTSVTIPDSVISIGEMAFSDCTGLASVTIPDSVIDIGGGAFSGTAYYNDESNWENDVLYIGNCLIQAHYMSISGSYSIREGTVCIAGGAFSSCSGLTSVTIPDSVTSIGGGAFYNCSGITSVTYNGTKKQWKAISKSKRGSWKENTGNFTVYCTDGQISKEDA